MSKMYPEYFLAVQTEEEICQQSTVYTLNGWKMQMQATIKQKKAKAHVLAMTLDYL